MNILSTQTRRSKIIENDRILCCLIGDDIYYSYVKPDQTCSQEDIELIFRRYKELSNGYPLRIIAEMGQYSSMTNEARTYLEKHRVEAICEAAVTSNLAQRLIINFYHRVKKHAHPSRVFKNFDEAYSWVKSI